MSWFPRPSTPLAAIRDLIAVMKHSSREQRLGILLALSATGFIVFEFVIDSRFGAMPTPTPVYVELYSSNRTDAQIIADQKKDQQAKEAAQKAQQEDYQKLAKRFGIE